MSTVAIGVPASGASPAIAPPTAAGGALLVADILAGQQASNPRDLTVVGSTLFFTAATVEHGRELWRSDGTAGGTRLVRDIAPGKASSAPSELTAANNTLFFSAQTARHGRELWASDGTGPGTKLLKDIAPGATGSNPEHVTYGVNAATPGPKPPTRVLFSADDGTHGRELWHSTGTAVGTTLVADINPGAASSGPTDITIPASVTTAVFAADDGAHGRELWRSDATAPTTALLADIKPGPAGSEPTFVTGAGYAAGMNGYLPMVYASADDGTHGREPYASYLAGPVLPTRVIDIRPGAAGSDPQGFDPFAFDYVTTSADDGTHGREPFYLVPGGPREGGQDRALLIADLNPGPAGSSPTGAVAPMPIGAGRLTGTHPSMTRFSRAHVTAETAAGRPSLVKLDLETLGPVGQGGSHGVSGIAPANVSSNGTNPGHAVRAGTTLVYPARDSAHGRELWSTGGHATSTGLLADIRPGGAGSNPRDLTVAGERVFFTADDGAHGRELWTATVGQANLVSIVGPDTPTSGEPATFTLTVAPIPNGQPSGALTVWEGAAVAARLPLPSGQSSTTWTTALTPGTHSFTVTYSGDTAFAPSTSMPWVATIQ
jgi:ELWxxDGT repeat protein